MITTSCFLLLELIISITCLISSMRNLVCSRVKTVSCPDSDRLLVSDWDPVLLGPGAAGLGPVTCVMPELDASSPSTHMLCVSS